jgi:tRNA A37 methylthiotransferase MiaB
LTARSRGDDIVVFTGPESLIGQFVRIKVTSATTLTLHGQLVAPADRMASLPVL